MIKYRIKGSSTQDRLERDIEALIQEGYMPIGGVSTHYNGTLNQVWFYQALIKHQDSI